MVTKTERRLRGGRIGEAGIGEAAHRGAGAKSNRSDRDLGRELVEVSMLREQFREGDDVRHRPVRLPGIDSVVGDEILKPSVWHAVRLPGDASAGAEPVA